MRSVLSWLLASASVKACWSWPDVYCVVQSAAGWFTHSVAAEAKAGTANAVAAARATMTVASFFMPQWSVRHAFTPSGNPLNPDPDSQGRVTGASRALKRLLL